ncbi:hypothetical protein Hamer_G007673 [Homarus americanus]|uniref:Uncharacterized protein n=1 Tax=Homarus americanus TaxID=6706 RepID=A0A8J5JWY6_HOMAM|nr:hypothetical protein Hamer_G007673 [Homarus americanus]
MQKTRKVFSSIPTDQAHEQNNACIKGDGGAVGLTNNPSALRRWMVSGPEVARVIEEFKDEHQYWNSLDLVTLHTKEIASPSAAETVRNAKSIGQDQFQTFTRERLMEETKHVDAILHRNKLKVFSASISSKESKGKEQLSSLKRNTEAPPASSVVFDGAAVLQMLKPAAAKKFEEYAQEVFIPCMSTKLQAASRLDLVFGRKPVLPDLASIAPFNHEEANRSMLLHASHAAQHGHYKILIRTVDTDVVVWVVSVVQGMHREDELWLAFGTGKSFRYLAAHEMAACLGPKKVRALPMFHALTGCDSVYSFSGYGKKTAWAI